MTTTTWQQKNPIHYQAYKTFLEQWPSRFWYDRQDQDGKFHTFVTEINASCLNGPNEDKCIKVPQWIKDLHAGRIPINDELPVLQTPQKDSNPKTQFGIAKPDQWAVDPISVYVMGMAMLQGSLKYGLYNWMDQPVSASTYIEAARRHLDLYKLGQEVASDTGIEHLGHVMACCNILLSAKHHNTLIDDRRVDLSMAEVLEKFFEESQPLIKQIREQWTGFAERQKQQTPTNTKEA